MSSPSFVLCVARSRVNKVGQELDSQNEATRVDWIHRSLKAKRKIWVNKMMLEVVKLVGVVFNIEEGRLGELTNIK